jgi:beta-glucanase (GH16 family)
MLPIRKKIAVSASLVMATAGVVAFVQSATPATSASPAVSRQAKAAVTVSIVPGVIDPGSSLKKASAAKWAVIGKFSANKAGKKAKLQRRSGSSWVTAGKTAINKKGVALFAVPPAFASKPVTYRVDGPGSPSAPVSTSTWGTPIDFSDDFGGTGLDLTNWQHRQQDYYPESKRECSKGDPKAVRVAKGTAQLSVLVDKTRTALCKPKKPGKNVIYGKFRYRLNANIGTGETHSIRYGVVAARIKFNPLQGQHASLWMQPTYIVDSKDPAVQGTEIDIIEWFGKDTPSGGLTSFIYAPSYDGTKLGLGGDGWIKKPEQYLMNEKDDWFKRYHVFSVEWTPSAYIFRIDGQETGRITKGISRVLQYPILSILSSDYELPKLPKRDEKKNLPQTMNVDWIRTWQNPAGMIEPTPTATP